MDTFLICLLYATGVGIGIVVGYLIGTKPRKLQSNIGATLRRLDERVPEETKAMNALLNRLKEGRSAKSGID
jgi:hypothetical protein